MWLFTVDGFLSIVNKDCGPDELLVRARVKGDIERAFPDARVTETPRADYRYRAAINRNALADYLQRQVQNLDYENFKEEIGDHDRHAAYLQVWTAMHRMQEKLK
jgi:hypothetical protein